MRAKPIKGKKQVRYQLSSSDCLGKFILRGCLEAMCCGSSGSSVNLPIRNNFTTCTRKKKKPLDPTRRGGSSVAVAEPACS